MPVVFHHVSQSVYPEQHLAHVLRAGGRCMMGVVGIAERQRGMSEGTRQRHHMISQHEFCFRACTEKKKQTHKNKIRNGC